MNIKLKLIKISYLYPSNGRYIENKILKSIKLYKTIIWRIKWILGDEKWDKIKNIVKIRIA